MLVRALATIHRWLCGLVLTQALAVAAPPALALDPSKPYRDYAVTTWDVAQGLPQISVMAIAQGPEGELWLGTQAGLVRFDGSRFTPITGTSMLGLDNGILALRFDPQGRLWIGTTQGLYVLEGEDLERLPIAGARRFPVTALTFQGSTLLVGGPDGVYASTDNPQRWQRLLPLPGPVTELYPEGDALWVGHSGGVTLLRTGRHRTFAFPPDFAPFAPTGLTRFAGSLWAATRNGLLRLQDDGRWSEATPPGMNPQRAIEAILADRDGNLWVATAQSLDRWRPDLSVERILDQPGSRQVRTLLEDQAGILWTGSLTQGLARIWNGHTRHLSKAEGLTSPVLWTLAPAPDGSVLVGGNDGVERWRNGRFQPVVRGDQLPHPDAYALLAERDALWIGTRAGVAVLRAGQTHPERPAILAPLHGHQVHAIVRDAAGALWFGTSAGAFRLADHHLQQYSTAQGLHDPRVRIVLPTRQGQLLIGTADGLYEWRNGRILPLGQSTGLPPDTGVTALLELADGRLLLGGDQQLWLYAKGRWHDLGSRKGIPSTTVTHLAQVGDDLWVAGMQGVYRMALAELGRAQQDPGAALRTHIVINSGFPQSSGQLEKCCNGAGTGRGLLRDGQLWLPTREGVLLVSTRRDPPLPTWPLRIESVQIEETTADGMHIDASLSPARDGFLDLPLDARRLRIHFSVPALEPTRAPDLHYRLVGVDPDWLPLELPAQRSISYPQLKPARYVFKLADFATDPPLVGPARLNIHVPAHFYETRTTQLLAAMLLLALVWLGYRGLQYRYAQQRAELERLVAQHTQELTEANARLLMLSQTDPLTGLHNRRYLSEQMPVDLSFYARTPAFRDGREALVLAILDIDHFKRLNDTYGHAAGDQVLMQLGQLLTALKRSGDYAVRWGGEEFLLIFRPLPRGSLAQIGQRLCTQIAAHPFRLEDGRTLHATVSIGLVEYPLFPQSPHLLSWERMVSLADRALYAAKAAGRNAWMAWRPAPGAQPPSDVIEDPDWLISTGLLERLGATCANEDATLALAAISGSPSPPSPDHGGPACPPS